jgi:hypothetical protein
LHERWSDQNDLADPMVPQPIRHKGDVALGLRRIDTKAGVVRATEHDDDLWSTYTEGLFDPSAHMAGRVARNAEIDGLVALASNDPQPYVTRERVAAARIRVAVTDRHE